MLNANRRLLISAPYESVRSYLRDLGELPRYEPKVGVVMVSADGKSAEASGRFFGMPWHGTFRVDFMQDGGYRAVMQSGPLSLMEFRILIRPVNGGTMLEHDEKYELPIFLRPLSLLIRRWLDQTVETGLDVLKERAEALNRRLQLQVLES